jgi:hypothetical protein
MGGKEQGHGQAYRVHVDQDNAAVAKTIRQCFPPEEVEDLLKKRVQIVNVSIHFLPLLLYSY